MHAVRFALRTLFKSPFVTLVAIASLSLGIGANAAIFSLFNQLLLQPLPVPEPGRLVNLSTEAPRPGSTSCNDAGNCDSVFSYPMFRDLERLQTPFTSIGAHVSFGANLAARGHTENTRGMLVSGGYFSTLGVRPAIGRLIGPDDDRGPGASPVAVLSHRYWQRRFALDPGVLNQTIVVNGLTLTIVGVAERGFDGTTLTIPAAVFVPITMRGFARPAKDFDDRRSYWAYLFARLKPGVSIEQAQAALAAPYTAVINDVEAPLQKGASPRLLEQFKAKKLLVADGRGGQSLTRVVAKVPLVLLFSVTVFVLLIACANIANLLLARAAVRSKELGVRLALGAGRGQLVRMLLVESCLLAAFGAIGGLAVAYWTLHGMFSLLPPEAANTITPTIDATVVVFTGGLAIATGLAFGLFPALYTTRPNLVASLKEAGGRDSGGRAAGRFRTALVTSQVALSMALLVASGLFLRSLLNVSRVELGLTPERVVMFGVSPALNGYTSDRTKQLFAQLEEALRVLPGVTGVTSGTVPLLDNSNWGTSVTVEGFTSDPDADMGTSANLIAPAYFSTLGMTVLSGREFGPRDGAEAPKVAIVNEAFARKFNLGRGAVGRRMNVDGIHQPLDMEIVGLVKDAAYSQVKNDVTPQVFLPYQQGANIRYTTFYVRTAGEPEAFIDGVRRVVGTLDPNLPVENLRTLPEQIRNNVFLDRFIGTLSTAFAGLATLLAAIGLYGVLAYMVSQRTREIGIRMALGATPWRVRAMVLRQVGVITFVGLLIGMAGGASLGRLAESLLFRLEGWDPIVLAVSASVLTLVALAAALVPTLRASQIEPMRALRYE